MDSRIETLAKNLVNYSCKVKPGENVLINYTSLDTTELGIAKGSKRDGSLTNNSKRDGSLTNKNRHL